ncbi:RNA polymerase II transcription factor B subunit 2 [Tilletiaria anomala UBC 951]|uniref:RNA polymerase II transcription factor B subunit 2 n=1 Tax=Tilletiaria anomala (strain ATCC 24038 / CBS 436.72 / UBC 951) TaxID=1037660 RepID=A0A066WAW2_TILAU|nr:RNA polymerase II transcription factor B subunit 2 [Tilletiaria anomala UBC 951]KDN50836.1 RNA polymerase II transcription factor B subunit 2 [Tilletiaria anomala UBC 951]
MSKASVPFADPTRGDDAARQPATTIADQSRAAGIGAENINDFLDRQPPAILNRLFAKPASCLAIFRLLPVLARQLVMQMLFMDAPLALADWNAQLTKEGRRLRERTMKRLKSLCIIRESGSNSNKLLQMNGVFQENMRCALIGGGDHRSFGVLSHTVDQHAVDIAFLDNHAKAKWEAILHFLVGSEGFEAPREPVLYLLKQSGLMQKGNASAPSVAGPSTFSGTNRATSLKITARGFQFLLEDVNTQLWDLLLQYLALAEPRGMDLVEVMSFLFMLGSLELGRDYSTEELSETQLHMLEDFRDYGLVYQRAGSSRRFYPTRLATSLTSNASPIVNSIDEAHEEKGYIILETNYRVYAYTSNPLRIAVLNLFVTLKSRFPNLVIGIITRDSIKSALANGITAEQIIAYLTHHAHPQMWKSDTLLPVTCTDQIRLWEREKNRVAAQQGSLYTDFTSYADFELVRNYARESGVLLWESEETRRFFVSAEGTGPIRDFIKRRLV